MQDRLAVEQLPDLSQAVGISGGPRGIIKPRLQIAAWLPSRGRTAASSRPNQRPRITGWADIGQGTFLMIVCIAEWDRRTGSSVDQEPG